MVCPTCNNIDSKVIDKRNSNERNEVRRRRECLQCATRYTTYERVEKTTFLVRKKSGRMEDYDRNKLKNSILKGMKKRSVSEDRIERMLDQVEIDLMNQSKSVINSRDIGKVVLTHLRGVDDVAYMLYATVYLDFNCLEDIQSEINELKVNRDSTIVMLSTGENLNSEVLPMNTA